MESTLTPGFGRSRAGVDSEDLESTPNGLESSPIFIDIITHKKCFLVEVISFFDSFRLFYRLKMQCQALMLEKSRKL